MSGYFEQKYPVRTFDDLIMPNDAVEAALRRYEPVAGEVDFGYKKPLLLEGPYGTGKSTIIEIIGQVKDPNFQNANSLFIDADGRKNIQAFKSRIENFTSTMAINAGLKALKFDELDIMSDELQQLLKMQISEIVSKKLNVQIVMATNHLERVDGGIKSRCTVIPMRHLDPERMLPKMRQILIAEKVMMLPDRALLPIAQRAGGDIRKLYEELEILVDGLRAMQALPKPQLGLTLVHGAVK
jgi:DNA polymerase III delta prime subunit